MTEPNATFIAFKRTGKWKYTGRGYLSEDVFKFFTRGERRAQVLEDNDGKFPGMSTAGEDLVWVIIGDEYLTHGYPLMLHPDPVYA